jgi:F-box/leucine-rich repeat protein 2/20
MDVQGLRYLFDSLLRLQDFSFLKELRVSGLKGIDDDTMRLLGKAAPHLEILDLSHARQLHDSALEAFVAVNDTFDYARPKSKVVRLNALQTGREYVNDGYYLRRVTKLRHLSLSCCIMLTDMACSNLAHAVPHLEYLEMAGVGAGLKDDGLIRLLNTTPHIRRLDLEDAIDLTDSVLSAITPPIESADQKQDSPQSGYALEWLIVSHASNLTDEALLAVIHACPKLRVLEADDTKLSGSTLKEFVTLCRQRRASDARVVAIDCRGVVEGVVKELGSKGALRPRLGVRAFWARRLGYVDGKDEMCEEDLKIGYDECDSEKVIVKTFYSWQSVDTVRSAREKRRKTPSGRAGNISPDFPDDIFDSDFANGAERSGGLTRWWSPNGRSSNGRNSPAIIPDLNNDGCIIM